MFISFANFHQRFIKDFNKIAVLLISMLKTTELSEKLALRAYRTGNNDVVGGGDDRVDEIIVDLFKSKNKKSKKLMYMPNIGATRETNFLTPNIKKAFNYLRLAFIEARILWHFDLESHIKIKTDVSGYAIGEVLSQLNLDFDTPPNNSNNSNSNKSDFS